MENAKNNMSWLNNETGRPEEDGGHQRIDISADYHTREVLDSTENKSKFVEECIREFVSQKCVKFEEPTESSNDSRAFKDGAVFEFEPVFTNNTIKQVNISFSHLSAGGDIEFRLCVNESKGLRLVEKSFSNEYSFSHLYENGELGLKQFEAMLRGKDRYVFRFQFRSLKSFGRVNVKNIRMFIEIIDSPVIDDHLNKNNPKERNEATHQW